MREIKLTKGKVTIVNNADYYWLNRWKWHAVVCGRDNYYARRTVRLDGKNHYIYMHRLIMGMAEGDGKMVDHINHNGLDNRKSNLRLCNRSQNQHNSKARKGTSKYKGVCWRRDEKKWEAKIWYKNKKYHLGYFFNEIDATKAYDKKAKELHKEFACLNFQSYMTEKGD